ncbi:MAG: hypothetical protein CM1200mP1_03470 [Candidatus Neomarinimicrobiota bacterium]|nr:MAG: hypothetical protein CM1200mP1_03470 [Candidatus Neomarinimicrobiota bacterium]
MFENMWDWSLQENGLQVPNYSVRGKVLFYDIKQSASSKIPKGDKIRTGLL